VAGYREFQTGEILTSANVNEFLMKQAVMVFADATARTSALSGVVAEGMLTYNEDTAQLEVYDGSAFVVAAPAPPPGIGSNVVQAVKTDTSSTSSSTFSTISGLSVTITPSTDTSRILLLAQVNLSHSESGGNPSLTRIRLSGGNAATYIGGTDGNRSTVAAALSSYIDLPNNFALFSTPVIFLDSPGTASAVTYELQFSRSAGTAYVNRSSVDANESRFARGASSLTAIEVAP
jgi:hypothetical protein